MFSYPSEQKRSEPPLSASQEQANIALHRKLRYLFTTHSPPDQPTNQLTDQPDEDVFPTLFDNTIQVISSRNELLDYLIDIERGLFNDRLPDMKEGVQRLAKLPDIKRHIPPRALTRADEMTIDLVGKIFECVFRDFHIPDDIKALLSLLQVPILKAALIDSEFFFQPMHPARYVIELITKMSIGWERKKDRADPLYQAILRNVQYIQRESSRQISVFAEAVVDLEAFAEIEAAMVTQVLSKTISKALQKEKQLQAAYSAKHAIAQRIGTGEVAPFIETFLEDKWISVLTLAYELEDKDPQAARHAVKIMDDLVWSVKPKIASNERKELITLLPAMLAELKKWLDRIQCVGAEREQFFAELAACHASIVRASLMLSPKRQVEIAIEVSKQAAEQRQQRQQGQYASPALEPMPDEFMQQVLKLERGAWVQFVQKNGVKFKAKLAWISPIRSFYLFATGKGEETLSVSSEVLAKAFRERKAQLVPVAGLVDRALVEALGERK